MIIITLRSNIFLLQSHQTEQTLLLFRLQLQRDRQSSRPTEECTECSKEAPEGVNKGQM